MGRVSIPLVAACVALTAAGATAFLAPAASRYVCARVCVGGL